MLNFSPMLFTVLGMAALIGGLIGYLLARWLPDERHEFALRELEQKHTAAERESQRRVDVLSIALEHEREGAARNRRRWRERELSQAAKQETLESHARLQQNRLEDLLAEQRSTEEQLMRAEQRSSALRQEYGMAERDRAGVALPLPAAGDTARLLQSQLDDLTGDHSDDAAAVGAEVDVPLLERRARIDRWNERVPDLPETELPDMAVLDDILEEHR